jgi:hypothetical protein
VADEHEIQLGRLAVKRGFVTEEQVLTALRARNQDPAGPGLGELLVARGLLPRGILDALSEAVRRGEGKPAARPRRDEMSTEHEISLGTAREAIARESLEEAQAALKTRRDEALRELRRLADEFADTESGNRARALLEQHGAP